MAKRRLDFDEPSEQGTQKKKVRTKQPWFVRVGILHGPESKNRYGGRESINVESFMPPNRRDLSGYSLIIPSFTQRMDIPSLEDKQRRCFWLWNVYQHPRYFGLLDLDMDLDRVQSGEEPLFVDSPCQVYEKKGHVKMAFAKRLLDGSTFGQILSICPAFALLYGAVKNLLVYLEVPGLAYFSGGGGFRVLFLADQAWRTVTWGTTYASVFHEQELSPLLESVAPELDQEDLDILLASTDKNIYDCDKGTKPDLLAHFDTKIFPHPLDEHFESSLPSSSEASVNLCQDIRAYWVQVFRSIPQDPPEPILATISKPPIYPNPLYREEFIKTKKDPTHFVSQGEKSTYRRVDNVELLYQLLLEQRERGLPLNWHEIRTPVTRHCVDYDGGPPLLEELLREDGQLETPLHALQVLHQETVLLPGQSFPGLLLTCPPRAGCTGDRAHLIWPDWYVNLDMEGAIMERLHQGMTIRWPLVPWSKILESPLKLRALFSDTLDKETGLMANRPLSLEYAFDTEGQIMLIKECWPTTTDLDLLRLCSLRVLDKDESDLIPLQSLPVQPKSQHVSSTNLKDLKETDQKAVDDLMQAVLDQVRTLHRKPKAKFTGKVKVFATGKYRHLQWSLTEHRQCEPNHTHKGNNVCLSVYMDRDQWQLRCFDRDCPQNRPVSYRDEGTQIYAWRQGWFDTSLLRRIWSEPKKEEESPPPEPILSAPEPFNVGTPPPSPPLTESELETEQVLLIPDDRWDGKNVLIKESEVPTTEWTSILLSQESDPTQTWLLTSSFWSDPRKVRRFRSSPVHPYPLRIVPCQGLLLR